MFYSGFAQKTRKNAGGHEIQQPVVQVHAPRNEKTKRLSSRETLKKRSNAVMVVVVVEPSCFLLTNFSYPPLATGERSKPASTPTASPWVSPPVIRKKQWLEASVTVDYFKKKNLSISARVWYAPQAPWRCSGPRVRRGPLPRYSL